MELNGMHELPVTEQIVEIVLDHARKAKAGRVLKINLVIGELSGFVGESIQFYLNLFQRNRGGKCFPFHLPRPGQGPMPSVQKRVSIPGG